MRAISFLLSASSALRSRRTHRAPPRFGAIQWAGASAIAIALTAIACSQGSAPATIIYQQMPGGAPSASGTTEPQVVSSSDASADAGPKTCSLATEGVDFGIKTCNTCMQTSCCADVTGCFVNNAECTQLYSCINQCPSRGLGPGSGTGTGGDGGGGGGGLGDAGGLGDGGGGGPGDGGGAGLGDGGGKGDGGGADGDPCVTSCNNRFPAQVEAARAYIKCYAKSCVEACR